MSPTQRSLAKLREEGYRVAIVEKFNSFIKIRQDLWGFADLIAFNDHEVLLVQTTVGAAFAAHITKIAANPIVPLWLAHPDRKIVVHGWRKGGARGERKAWLCREELIELRKGRLIAIECETR